MKSNLLFFLLLVLAPLASCFSQKKPNTSNSFSQQIAKGEPVIAEQKEYKDVVSFIDIQQSISENENVYRQSIQSAIVFKKCNFRKGFLASLNNNNNNYFLTFTQPVLFDSCYFWEDTDFRGCDFGSSVNFRNCMFYGKANFEETEWTSNVWFLNCFFKKEVRFQNSFFNRKVNFFQCVYDDLCSFQSCFFNQDAQFSSVKFWKYTDFSLCTFNAGVFYNYAQFFEHTLFNNSLFRDRAEFINATFKKNMEMKSCKFFGEVKFNKTELNDVWDLGDAIFYMGKPDLPQPMNAVVKTQNVKYLKLESLQ